MALGTLPAQPDALRQRACHKHPLSHTINKSAKKSINLLDFFIFINFPSAFKNQNQNISRPISNKMELRIRFED
jgi:hypothetical protein